ncbi:MAG: exo-alpha-sialidase [Paludibacteraceae bacterium]|nr:exo-alpha-sialidase [Paludibacteraceae bacterium]
MKKIILYVILALLGITTQVTAQLTGTAVTPTVSTEAEPIYYYIESAAVTTVGTPGTTVTDILPMKNKGYVMYSPTAAGKTKYRISTGADDEQWTLVSISGTTYLKNKGTGLYFRQSHSVGSTANEAFTYTSLGSDQYSIKSSTSSSYLLAWNNATCDRWSSAGLDQNTAWFFTAAPAYSGNALNLNGSTNFMRIPHNAAFNFSNTEAFSISFWINSNLVAGRNARIIAKRGPNEAATTDKSGYEIWGLNTTTNFLAVNTTTGTSNTNLYSVWGTVAGTPTTWTHIAYVVTGTGTDRNIIMYQNGQVTGSAKISNKDVSTFSVTNGFDVFIGKGQYDGGSGKVNGKMDNIRFWNKALSAVEVESDQATVVNASTPNLIAAYDFETVDLNAMTVADIKGTHTANLEGYSALTASVEQFGMSGRGNTNDPILRATVTVSATDAVGQPLAAVNLNNAILNLTGTTSLSDITSLKVYSTGTNVNFDPRDPITKGAVLLASCSPAAGDISCTLSGTLAAGTNYLWITADIANNATEGNQIDIALKSITYNTDKIHTLAANNPTGTTNIMLARKLIVAPGDAGSANYRIPAVITAKDGSVILFTDKRKFNNTDLPQDIDVVTHRSTDNGKTWSTATTIAQGTGVGAGFGDVATVKTKTGKIISLFAGGAGFVASTSSNPIKVYKSESTDNGISWSAPTDITSQLYAQGCSDPTRATWSGLFIASGQMLYTSTGRIMAVGLVRGDGSGTNNNYIVYSDDEGTTWTMSNSKVISSGDEAKIMELADGTFMVTSRRGGASGRLKATSPDGLTWTETSSNISELVEPACNGDFIRYSKAGESTTGNILLHSIPNNASSRRNVSVFYSTNEGTSWTLGKSIVPVMANNGLSGYSALTVLADGTIGAYVEVENYSGVYGLVYMNFSLNWLTSGLQTFAENRWTGAVSNDYSNVANWSAGAVPQGETPDIVVAGNAANPLLLSGTQTFGSITVNPGARLTLDSENITASSINIISNGTGMGTVLDNTNLTTRNATVKVQLTGKTGVSTNDNWWYITTPVTGATSDVFKNDVSNLFGYYNEATATYPQITTTTSLNKGNGYLVKLGGANAYYDLAGTLNNGDVTVNLTRTGTTNAKRGFNLVGNPYPSYINWNTLLGSRTDIRPTIWYRSRTAGGQMVFDTWNGLTGTGAGKNGTVSQYIPPMQAFWVKVDKDGTTGDPVLNTVQLTFSNTVRSHRPSGNATSSLLRAPQQNELQLIRLQVSNGSNRDETILMASELASNGIDRYDAEKMQNNNTEIPEIAIWMNNTETAINAVNQFPLNTEIPLIFRPGKDGNFSLSATEIKTAEENIEFILKDSNGDTETILNNGDKYSFAAATTDTRNRFAFVLRTKGTTTGETQFGLNPIKAFASAQQRIIVENIHTGNNILIFSATGQLLESITAKSQRTESTGNFTKGVYFVKVSNYVQKIIIH